MKKSHFGLIEAAFLLLLVALCLFCPFFSPSSGNEPSSRLLSFVELARLEPLAPSCLASYVFLPLLFLWSVAKALFSCLLHGKGESTASFALYIVWAALGLGYLVFLGKGQSYWAFLTVLLFTSASIPFFYLERRFFPVNV
jgi:hypothetical protein